MREANAHQLQMQIRRSRMRRTCTGRRIEIQPRDLEIFALLERYRYLRSTYIHAFVGGDKTKLIERLGKLYHEAGYLNRPSEQWECFQARCRPVVYENAAKAREMLTAYQPDAFGGAPSSERHAENRQFAHSLMVSDVLASVELATRAFPGLRFVPLNDILAKAPEATRYSPSPLRIPVSIVHRFERSGRVEQADLHLIPDGLFGLEYANGDRKSYRFFALEADRGTMPAARETLWQSSYLRKVLAYRQVMADALHKSVLGIPNLFVLNVMHSETHMRNVMALVAQTGNDPGNKLFLFKTLPESRAEPVLDLLASPWAVAGDSTFDIGRA